MSYYFFVGSTMLPVPPAKMTLKVKGENKTIDLINEGEVNVIKTPGLSEISFDARLPNQSYPWANYDSSLSDSLIDALSSRVFGSSFTFKKADYFLKDFETAKTSQIPLRLVITRMTPGFSMLGDTNMLVTLEDYSVNEDSENGFDYVVPLKFKQYRPYGTKECEVKKDKDGNETLVVKPSRQAVDKVTPADYKISSEQSVWEACKNVSGGELDWRSVMQMSGITNPCQKGLEGVVLHFG